MMEQDVAQPGAAYRYESPKLTVLGSLEELTLGASGGFPDECSLAVGSVVGTDPCSGQPLPGGGGAKP